MTKEHKLYELSKELVYQMTGKYTEDIQDGNFQIAWHYLSKAMDFIPCCKSVKGEQVPTFDEFITNFGLQADRDNEYFFDNEYYSFEGLYFKYAEYYKINP